MTFLDMCLIILMNDWLLAFGTSMTTGYDMPNILICMTLAATNLLHFVLQEFEY